MGLFGLSSGRKRALREKGLFFSPSGRDEHVFEDGRGKIVIYTESQGKGPPPQYRIYKSSISKWTKEGALVTELTAEERVEIISKLSLYFDMLGRTYEFID